MATHVNTAVGWPQTRAEVEALDTKEVRSEHHITAT